MTDGVYANSAAAFGATLLLKASRPKDNSPPLALIDFFKNLVASSKPTA